MKKSVGVVIHARKGSDIEGPLAALGNDVRGLSAAQRRDRAGRTAEKIVLPLRSEEPPDPIRERKEDRQRVHSRLGHRGVRTLAAHPDPQPDRALFRKADLLAGGLDDDKLLDVREVSPADERLRPGSADLFVRGEAETHRVFWGCIPFHQGTGCEDHRRQTALHVRRPASEDAPVRLFGPERGVRPQPRVADGDRIHVSGDGYRSPGPVSLKRQDQARTVSPVLDELLPDPLLRKQRRDIQRRVPLVPERLRRSDPDQLLQNLGGPAYFIRLHEQPPFSVLRVLVFRRDGTVAG